MTGTQNPPGPPEPQPPPRLKVQILFGDAASWVVLLLLVAVCSLAGGAFKAGVAAESPIAGAVTAVGVLFAGVGVLFALLQRA